MKGIVELVGIGNFVRLEDGASENRLFIRLPNGKDIESVISDAHLADVVECFSGRAPAPPPPPQTRMEAFSQSLPGGNPAVFQEETLPSGEKALVFGGQEERVEDLPPIVEPPPRKSRLVGRDDAGNPVVEVDGEDPSMVTGDTGDKDEDGVAQL
jgi:hypothetical protein